MNEFGPTPFPAYADAAVLGIRSDSLMAAMMNWINQNLDKHIVTIEDPIEYELSGCSGTSDCHRSIPYQCWPHSPMPACRRRW